MHCSQRCAEPFEHDARVIWSGHIELAVVSRIHGLNRPDLEMNTCRDQIAHTFARTERNQREQVPELQGNFVTLSTFNLNPERRIEVSVRPRVLLEEASLA